MRLWDGPWTMKRALTIAMWLFCCVHIGANVEAWILRKRAGLPFRLLP